MIEVVPARPQHLGTIARRMREIDRLECEVAGHTPKEALRTGLLGSSIAWTVKIDGRPEAMMGAAPVNFLEGRGRAWLLMTDVAARHSVALVRLGRIYTAALHRHYPILENWIHADNDKTIRWLSRLGYAVGAVDVIRGQPMRPFIRHA
jgi:hypothetical protein